MTISSIFYITKLWTSSTVLLSVFFINTWTYKFTTDDMSTLKLSTIFRTLSITKFRLLPKSNTVNTFITIINKNLKTNNIQVTFLILILHKNIPTLLVWSPFTKTRALIIITNKRTTYIPFRVRTLMFPFINQTILRITTWKETTTVTT